MSKSQSTSADGIEWDLSDLYEGHEDPGLKDDMDELIQRAEEFRGKYKGEIEKAELQPEELRDIIEEYEEIYELMGKIQSFANLYHAVDTQDPDRGALLQKAEEIGSEAKNKLIFLELEWQDLSDESAEKYLLQCLR